MAGSVEDARYGAVEHVKGWLGIPMERAAPAGATLEKFVRRPVEYRHAYAAAAVETFGQIARRLGREDAVRCYARIGPKAGPALDWLTETGSVPGRHGVLATLRRMCLGDGAAN